MLKAVVYLVAPVALIALFLYVRRRTNFKHYLLFTVPFLVAALSVWLWSDNLVFYYYGPKLSEGFRTWAVSAVIGAISLVCSFRINNRFAVFGQAVAALLFADTLVMLASWIA